MAGESALTSKYELYEEIGRGRFGRVMRCYAPISNEFYACKTIDKRLLTDALDRECLEMEPKIMALLSPHPNIVQFFDCFESNDSVSIIMELFDPPVTIYDRLISSGPFSERETAAFGKQILRGLAHCHMYGVVHRDVKPENVMVDLRNGAVKLCDFGSAVWLEQGATTGGVVGTPYYLAPEVVMGRVYGEKVDVWSAGVVLYTMIAGSPPFSGESTEVIFGAVLRANLRFPPRIFASVSAEAKDLFRKMICKDAARRISAEEALRHPWILNGGD